MLPALISAGANLVSGIIGRNQEKDTANKNIALQKEFAQSGIQWKVEDAKKAGLHPLAALGAQTSSFAPVSVGGSSIASGISAAGQDISRAVNATRSDSARVDAYTKTVQDLNLQRLGLENQVLAAQLAKINQAGIPPAMPSAGDRYLLDGQANSGLIKTEPMERSTSAPGSPHQEPGAIPDVGFARTATGWAPVMSGNVKDRLEEDFPGMITWNVRNRLAPTIGASFNAPDITPPEGSYWIYHPATQEYRMFTPRRSWRNPGFKYTR